MIAVHALSRRYDTLTAVDNVSFNIKHGEIVGLLGHNGAGKTTMMKMLAGYLEPSAGSIRIHGLNINQERRAIQRHIGYLPENCPLYPEMTVLDYLDYQAVLHGIGLLHRARALRRAVERTELDAKITAAIGTLSRGYRQRVGVAAAILHTPSILILDEPTNGLDPTQIQHMRALVRELSAEATLLISTHVLQEVEAVCDRVLILRNGRLALDRALGGIGESRLMVTLDRTLNEVAPVLSGIAGVDAIEEESNSLFGEEKESTLLAKMSWENLHLHCHRFALTTTDPYCVAPAVAAASAQYGWALYELTPERQNLEALFSAVTLAVTEDHHV